MRYRMVLDADKGDDRFAVAESIRIRQGDSLSYELEIDVRQGGEVVDLSDYAVRLYATKPDGSAVIDGENLEVVDAAAGRVLYTVPRQLVDAVGKVSPCYLRITEAANQSEWSLSTDSFELDVVRGVGASLASGEYVPEIDGLLADMDRQLDDFQAAEDGRASAEALRETDEAARVEAERQRAEAEEARRTYEEARRSAEDLRIANESGRVSAENARKAAEEQREAEFAVIREQARPWAGVVLAPGEYDSVTFEPSVEPGEWCTVYFTPSADPTGANAFDEWMYVDGRWEKLGAASVEFDAATAEQIAGILAGTLKTGGAAVTVTGLAAFREGLDAAYAALSHSHDIEDVEGLRGELDGLDGRIAKLPTVADLNSAVQALGVIDDALEANLTALYDSAMQTLRGTCSDVSYASLRALAPGCYLVPSTATNQPASGQGDANLLVAQDSGNRVWAVLAYNTGAVYCAYGYATGSGDALVTTNFKWARLDHGDPMLMRRQRGSITDASFDKLYALSQSAPGTYLMHNDAVNNPSAGNYCNVLLTCAAGNRMVCVVFSDSGAVYAARGYLGTWAWVRLDANGTSAVQPIDRGGTGATTVKGAVKALFPTENQTTATQVCVAQSDGGYSGYLTFAQVLSKMGVSSKAAADGSYVYWVKVGNLQIVSCYVALGSISSSHTYSDHTFTFTKAFSATPNVFVTGGTMHESVNGKNMRYNAVGVSATQFKVRVFGNLGYDSTPSVNVLAIGYAS